MGQRDLAAVAALGGLMALGLSGCFTAQVVRTDTLVSYELIRAPEAPPAIPEGTVLSAPSPAPAGVTWMEPYWMWSGSAYTWIVGRWVPTLAGYAFLQPRWRRSHGGWAMVGGAWVDADGRVIATPPPDSSTSSPPPQCDAPPTSSATAAGPTADPPRGRRTVTLGHLSYEPLREEDDDDAQASEHVDAAAPSTAATSYAAPSVPTYRAPVRSGSSYATAPSAPPPSGGASSRTGYAPSTASSSASATSSPSGSTGRRTGYASGSTAVTSATHAP